MQEVVATRHIKQGEEITLNYMPAKDEGSDCFEVRQDYLRTWYGFRCICQACTIQV